MMKKLLLVALSLTIPSTVPTCASGSDYPNKPSGLKKLVENLILDAKAGQAAVLDSKVANLRLPDHEKWFKENFGDQLGAGLTKEYESVAGRMSTDFAQVLTQAARARKRETIVLRFEGLGRAGLPEVLAVIGFAREPIEIYVVAIEDRTTKQEWSLGQFVYVNGGFRSLGQMLVVVSGNDAKPRVFSLGSLNGRPKPNVQPRPRYPQAAKDSRIQGAVRIAATLDRNGHLRDVRLLAGHALLAQSSLAAVVQWQFTPVTLDSQPVEIQLIIEVLFELRFD